MTNIIQTNTVEPTGLTTEEGRRFDELTGIIESGMKSFLEVGNALAEVRDRKLYRESYSSFDDYLEEKFGIKRHYASRLIKAESVVSGFEKTLPIGNTLPMPVNEAQVRPLLRLETQEEQLQAWESAVAAKDGRNPTAKEVTAAVNQLLQSNTTSESSEEETDAVDVSDGDAPTDGEEDSTQAGEPDEEDDTTGIDTADSRDDGEPAILADGSERPGMLQDSDYIDVDLAQRKLNEISKRCPTPVESTVVVQQTFLEIIGLLNRAVEHGPSPEVRHGFSFLFRDLFPNLILVAAKPGDMEPELPNGCHGEGRDH